MADGFIVRKGGAVTEQASAPTITEVSTTETSITFTITNNDASTAVILYEVDDATPDENSIELATGVTSDSIEITGLDIGTEYTVSATASVTGKVLSNVTSLAIETEDVIYTAATGGTTTEYDSGGKRYKSHTFTSDGNFIVSTVGDATDDRNKVDYLIIAGGGGGGNGVASAHGGGGGGAGGYRTTLGTSGNNSTARTKITVTATTYSIDVGAGGSGGTSGTGATNGTTSSFDGVSTVGGGRGANYFDVASSSGGSGGGGAISNSSGRRTGSAGTTDEGTSGGNAEGGDFDRAGGGGGGAGEAGANAASSIGGKGGDGLANSLRTGSNETRAGGGGAGGGVVGESVFAQGGAGGGGTGGINTVSDENAQNATVNTGSGGGGGGGTGSPNVNGVGGNGADGIVIIRYEIAPSV